MWRVGSGGGDLVGQLRRRGLVDLLDHSGPTQKLRVTPEWANEVREELQEAGVPYHVMVKDLAAYLQVRNLCTSWLFT